MLPHLILKPCECQFSTMSSSLKHRPIITFCGLECRNGLSLKVSFHEKMENERRNKGRCKRNSDWLLKRAILPFNQSDFGWVFCGPISIAYIVKYFHCFFLHFPFHFTIGNFIIFLLIFSRFAGQLFNLTSGPNK